MTSLAPTSDPPNFVLRQTERLFGSSSPFMWMYRRGFAAIVRSAVLTSSGISPKPSDSGNSLQYATSSQ